MKIIWLTLILALAAAGELGLLLMRTPGNAAASTLKGRRAEAILQQAREIPTGSALIIGDSLVEWQRLDQLCGPTLNAGVAGARLVDLAPLLSQIMPVLDPKLVIVGEGANDLMRHKTPIDQWIASYGRFLDMAGRAKLIVTGVSLASGEANAALERLARARGAVYVAPTPLVGHTSDNIHLNTDGARLWRAAVRASCAAAGFAVTPVTQSYSSRRSGL